MNKDEFPRWPGGGTPEWWARPEHKWVAESMGNRVGEIAALEARAAEARRIAQIAEAEAENCEETAEALKEELDSRLQALDYVERPVYFEPHTLLLRLGVKADEYDSETIAEIIKEAKTSYGTGSEPTQGIIIDVITDPGVGRWKAGFLVEMPDKELFLLTPSKDGYRIGDKDPEVRPFPKIN
jgi:hypothetical protein